MLNVVENRIFFFLQKIDLEYSKIGMKHKESNGENNKQKHRRILDEV